jgi:chromosomal replication initiator protein
VTTDDTDIVSALRRALADKVGKDRFELWFGASPRMLLDHDRLTISTPSPLFQDWLRTTFRVQIEAVCRETLKRCVTVEFRVDPSVAERPPSSDRQQCPPSCPESGPAPKPERAATRPPKRDAPDGAPLPRPLDLDSFVTGRSNRLARAAAEMVIERPGEFSPLVVHGPTSVGKTHLLQAICSSARAARPAIAAVYLSAEQFTAGFVEAVRGSGLPSFRQKCRGGGFLLIDDLQFLSGKKATQVELLYTMDTLARDGRQMVFAADRPPIELEDLGPELRTRLQSGIVCRIDPPDYETRLGIVDQMARRKKLSVPPEVKRLIALRLTSHARELSGALCRLEALSQALHKPIDLAMAEDALADMIRQSTRLVRLLDIEKAVCAAFGLEAKSLQSGGKAKRISHPRMLAMWLARKYTRAALSEIGQYFGRRSHSTVISAQKRIEDWLAQGVPVEAAGRAWTVEEAIQQVERLLLAT